MEEHKEDHVDAYGDEQGGFGDEEDDSDSTDSSVETVDPVMMALTEAERALARQLKAAAIECEGRLGMNIANRVSDFQFAQHAVLMVANPAVFFGVNAMTGIADQETVEDALDRVVRLLYFKDEYCVKDTLEEATSVFEEWLQQNPGLLLYLNRDYGSRDPITGSRQRYSCVRVVDAAAVDAGALLSPPGESWRTFIVGRYYQLNAVFPHFAAVREGSLQIFEAEGVGWESFRHQVNFYQKCLEELVGVYPANYKAIQLYNSPSSINTVVSLSRKFFGAGQDLKISVGNQIDEATVSQFDRLSDLFETFTTAHMIESYTSMLRERAANEVQFSL